MYARAIMLEISSSAARNTKVWSCSDKGVEREVQNNRPFPLSFLDIQRWSRNDTHSII